MVRIAMGIVLIIRAEFRILVMRMKLSCFGKLEQAQQTVLEN